MNSRLFAVSACAAIVAASSFAHAHAVLINPPPLTNDDNAKAGPCGCYFGAGPEDPNEDGTASACPKDFTPTVLEAGATLQVTWKETVQHTGDWRIAISSKPIETVTRADMNASVQFEGPDMNSQSGGVISQTIVVPEMSCDGCALQLRQFMAGAAKPYYYSCAAITIKPKGGVASSSSSSSSGAGGGGAGGGGGGMGGSTGEGGSTGPGPATQPPATTTGACSTSTGGASTGDALGIAALAILGLAARRRRSS
ncbi:SCE4755 family polysaccharide monooxygenase-like protein [Polyangium aurulentum]|uniref:SCE4755 family polysaccharide monooxygenase-like protein n=1 Tax=Polyangium aurulentum TaxID=2567896 RepID=UPI0010AE525C|nr:SCE4755 family polysaccharide monooxygenase-like protein [Polyangium aurulentum]UQA62589.1 lytic polysaccharide monooxygenase [Polyangium aurulentum]